ncbi:hypothetical protein KUL118_01500 [Tenacibaculum sp. KUL118]|nr:hypothetical protein KUL118_01500 [Tenacibaculum sp. KUL118]
MNEAMWVISELDTGKILHILRFEDSKRGVIAAIRVLESVATDKTLKMVNAFCQNVSFFR